MPVWLRCDCETARTVDVSLHGTDAPNEVYFAATPVATFVLRPQEPDGSAVSLIVIIQFAGSVAPVCQTFAYNVAPSTRKRTM